MHRSFAFVLACFALGGCAASGRTTHVTTVERVVYVETPARPCACGKPHAHGPHAQRERQPQYRPPRRRSHEQRKPTRYERQHARQMARAAKSVDHGALRD